MSSLGKLQARVPSAVAHALNAIGDEKIETHWRGLCEAYMPKPTLRTGDIVSWIVIDPTTGEQVMRCFSRAEAREMAHAVGARFCKLEVSR